MNILDLTADDLKTQMNKNLEPILHLIKLKNDDFCSSFDFYPEKENMNYTYDQLYNIKIQLELRKFTVSNPIYIYKSNSNEKGLLHMIISWN